MATLKSIVVPAGDCVILPADAVINSIVVDGAATATSTCGALPTPSSYKCGFFSFFVDVDVNDENPLDEENTFYTSITVGGNTYIINELVVQGDNPGTLTAVGTLNLHITDTALFEFMAVDRTLLEERQLVSLFFRVPDALYDTLDLKLSDRGTFYHLYPQEQDCEDYTPAG